MNLERIYSILPWQLQNVAASAEGWRVKRLQFGGDFPHILKEAIDRTSWPLEKIQDYRDRQLKDFMQHCYETTPYFQALFRKSGAIPDDFTCLDSLKRLPVLTKQVIQEDYTAFLSKRIPSKARLPAHTSGTTGAGLRFSTTREAVQRQWAVWWRYRLWHGIYPGTWCAYFGGRSVVPLTQNRPPFWRHNYPGKQILFSGYHMNEKNLNYYVEAIRRFQPPWIHGYPSLISLLASHMIDRKLDVGYQPGWITIGAENLLEPQKKLIFEAFGVKARQHYGSVEAVANISECELGNLHVDEDFSAVEFVPEESGYRYRVLGTNFTNPAFPLVRYDTGDVVTLSNRQCACTRPGRLVEDIDGRLEDYVILANGAKLGRTDHIFKDMVNIREAQIYQTEPGAFTIRVVRGSHYSETDEAMLLSETTKRVGSGTRVAIEYTSVLQRSATGKLRQVVSQIPHGRLDPRETIA